MLSHLKQLMHHMAWADALAWDAVLALPGPQPDRRLRELLYHVHTVQCAYDQLLRSEPLRIPESDSFGDLASLRAWGRECHDRLAAFVISLDVAGLDRPVEFPWAEQLVARFGEPRAADAGQALLQVAMHSSYHRGQIATRIRELGGEPPLTDFIAFVWMDQPEPA